MDSRRRLLPSLSLLRAFEAVCRTGSTAAAARELALTQGAVSRLVQRLEEQLGVVLFRRERRRLVPTEAALAYAGDVRKALDLVTSGALRLRMNPGGGTLSLAILPTFGTRWMAPRLAGFLAAHPGVTLNIATRMAPFDFTRDGFDAAIHFGAADWPEAGHLRLFDERLIAACAPDLPGRDTIRDPRDIIGLPLLHLESRPGAWELWLRHHGIGDPVPHGMLFDQFATMIQAGIHGLGVALLPEFLAVAEIDAGRLVRAGGERVPGMGSYFLVWPRSGANHPPLLGFRTWLEAETAALRDDTAASQRK